MVEFTEQTWSDVEIDQALNQLPSLIDHARTELITLEHELKQVSHIHRLAMAAAKLEFAKDKKPKPTATEMIAYAEQETESMQNEVFDKEKEVELAKAKVKYLQDMFDSAKKAANQKAADMGNVGRERSFGPRIERDPETNRIKYT